ncbi:hypothetical protein HY969_03165 [Candidatus Kaiserbacteria bacterium]|nr:hypothetical protein [Candidatus Kaiserbacteria bacterium]
MNLDDRDVSPSKRSVERKNIAGGTAPEEISAALGKITKEDSNAVEALHNIGQQTFDSALEHDAKVAALEAVLEKAQELGVINKLTTVPQEMDVGEMLEDLLNSDPDQKKKW